jgi:hypothetical protein
MLSTPTFAAAVEAGDVLDFFGFEAHVTEVRTTPSGNISIQYHTQGSDQRFTVSRAPYHRVGLIRKAA